MDDFRDWIGREETQADIACPHRVAGLLALLDADGTLPDALPLLGHWLLAPPIARQSALGLDGHPRRGGDALLPPIAQPRRMWAGSDIQFDAPVPLGAPIVRRTRVAAIEPKTGRSGAMVFVTLDHAILVDGAVAIRERQHIVYRDAPGDAPAPPGGAAEVGDHVRTVTADPVALFRYSALTFNGHRIHYDRDHARVEGYPGLVVHGPFAATLLLNHYRATHPEAEIAGFAFRARAPMFDGDPFTLHAAGERLWIGDTDGRLAMSAEVTVR